jgi:hypothetical protein
MLVQGVDVADPSAVATWTAEFNALPFEARDAILGMSLPANLEDEAE